MSDRVREILFYLLLFAGVLTVVTGITWEIEHWNDPDIHLPSNDGLK